MNKRGISAVVATVLIVLITILAITLLWGMIRPVLIQGGEGVNAFLLSSNLNLEIVERSVIVDPDGNDITRLTIRRKVGRGNLAGIKIKFTDVDGNSKIYSDDEFSLNELETKSISCFDLSELSTIEDIEVFPVTRNENGDSIVGNPTDNHKINGLEIKSLATNHFRYTIKSLPENIGDYEEDEPDDTINIVIGISDVDSEVFFGNLRPANGVPTHGPGFTAIGWYSIVEDWTGYWIWFGGTQNSTEWMQENPPVQWVVEILRGSEVVHRLTSKGVDGKLCRPDPSSMNTDCQGGQYADNTHDDAIYEYPGGRYTPDLWQVGDEVNIFTACFDEVIEDIDISADP